MRDETINAAYFSGRMLPAELHGAALGWIAMTPSAPRRSERRGGLSYLYFTEQP